MKTLYKNNFCRIVSISTYYGIIYKGEKEARCYFDTFERAKSFIGAN
jgi:hypothetical protein